MPTSARLRNPLEVKERRQPQQRPRPQLDVVAQGNKSRPSFHKISLFISFSKQSLLLFEKKRKKKKYTTWWLNHNPSFLHLYFHTHHVCRVGINIVLGCRRRHHIPLEPSHRVHARLIQTERHSLALPRPRQQPPQPRQYLLELSSREGHDACLQLPEGNEWLIGQG